MFVRYSDRIPFDFEYDLCYVYYYEHCQEHIHFVYPQHQTDLRKPLHTNKLVNNKRAVN